MDADGNGRKQFQLPDEGYVGNRIESSVSPDGKWLAYFTGSTEEPYNLALNLLNLSDGSSLIISSLIAPNFPQNLEPAIKKLKFTGCINNEDCKLHLFMFGLIEGLILAWSPDGKQLAFAAQIDGPSSDIYVFSIENKTILRLTNELENIYSIDWSPNGKKIIYEASIEGIGFFPSTLWYLADFTLAIPQHSIALSEEQPWRGLGWFDEDLFFISTAVDSPDYVDVSYIDTNSKETKVIWPYIAESMVLHKENHRIILSSIPYEFRESQPDPGMYLLHLDGTYSKISNEFFNLFPEQVFVNSYLAMDKNDTLVSISPNGDITNLAQMVSRRNPPRVSPNKRWVIITRDNVTRLFSKNIRPINSWEFDVSEVIWRTDSTGSFLYDREKLYYLSIPDGTPISIDICISKDCWLIYYTWLP